MHAGAQQRLWPPAESHGGGQKSLQFKPILMICIGHALSVILGFCFYVKEMGGLEMMSALLHVERTLKP